MTINDQNKISIEMWSDFMCPLCYIGKINLENAVAEFPHKDEVEVNYRPFQLFPDAPGNTGKGYYEYTSMTHGGLPVDYVRESNKRVIALAKSVGLNYNLDILIPGNTSHALQISLYAKAHGRAKEWGSRIYKAYFIEGLDIIDPGMLAKFGSEIGLDQDEILMALNNGTYKTQLESEHDYAESIGVKGTPFFVINNRLGISGIKSKEDFLDILNKALAEAKPAPKLNIIAGQSCDIDGNCD